MKLFLEHCLRDEYGFGLFPRLGIISGYKVGNYDGYGAGSNCVYNGQFFGCGHGRFRGGNGYSSFLEWNPPQGGAGNGMYRSALKTP
jgi:hypothetical protein